MASSMGRAGLTGSAGAQRAVRKGVDVARHSARGSSSRAAPSFVPKSLRSEDLALLKEAETYMSPEEHAELRRLLEENSKLRQVVTSNATHLSPQQLERFTKEYSNLAKEAEQAGVAVDASLKQQQVAAAAPAAAPARFSGVMAARTSPSQAAAESGASAIQANMGYSNRSYGVSVMVEDRPPSPPRPPAAKQPPPPPRVSAAPPPSFDFEVKSRDYARDMASLSVELDGTVDDDDDTDGLLTEVPVASTRVPTDGPHTTVSSRFEPLLSDRRPANINGVQADVADQLRQEAGVSQETERQKAVLRAAALAEVESHRPADVIKGREHWMIITVPEKPVAGAPMQLYFNRNQSEKLKSRPHIVLQYGFNSWELQPETGNRLDLAPAPVPKSDITDFWSCRMEVPEDTFEINFILHDNNGIFENNNNMDFTYTLEAGITYDQWIDTAAERLVQKELARKEAEAKAAAEAKQKAKELMHEQAKEFGRKKAEELQANYSKLQEGGTSALMKDGNPVFKVTPTKPAAGSTIRLAYNRKAGPFNRFDIPTGQHLTLLYGFNGWQNGGKAQMFRPATPPAGADPATEDWFECEVALPREAAAMNFVMNYYEHYDNNGSQDYKVAVQLPKGTTLETWAGELAEELRQRELERRLAAQALAEEKERKREIKKKLAQDQVKAVERRKVRHVLFTVPEVVQAGQEVTVFYNPHDTSLNGRQQIYLMGGWNRWTHKRHFGPIAMHPPSEGEEHWQATVTVPKDAYKMDFVFSDVPGGDGTYDNRGGFDYHLPVEGSPVREQPLYVAHIAVEMAPIAKVGGLGDVVTALGRAVKEQGHMVEVILPRYEFFAHSPLLNQAMQFETEFDWGGTRIVVTSAVVENLRCFFIEPRNGFFNTPTVYGRYDDEVRFDFFCKAALEFLLKTGRQPDILHCHDWSSAHVAQSYWQDYHAYGLYKPRVVFTIHNLNYGQKKIGEAAHACQKFTTVSPTYAFEVGGAPIIAPHAHKFMGIRNGIDPELWSPEENIFLPAPYSSENVVEGKKAARQALRQRLNLTSWNDKFIVAVVSRLTGQKGVPLIKHAAFRTIDRGGQFVLLGSAPDPKVQADFNALAQSMGGQDAAFQFKYDEPLSHLIYAAADMIVVPSMFEPCGLTQMIAMRYGTVPIVRHTGGLRDTVFDVDFDKERAAWELYGSSDWQRDEIDATNGFAFTGTDAGALDYAMNRAIDAWYNDRAWFHSLQQRVMEQDWSWNRPAIDYIELYFSALKS